MTLPKNTRTLRSGELPPPGTLVYVPENTAAFAGLEPTYGWRTVRATNSNNSTIAVKATNGYTSWVLSHNLLVADESPRRPTVGDRVAINVPDEPGHGRVGKIIEDDGTALPYCVQFEHNEREWFSPHEVTLVSDGDTFPGEMDTTTTTDETTITTTTRVTLPRPATAAQVAAALTHVDPHHAVTVHTYADRIEIHAHHEETRHADQ